MNRLLTSFCVLLPLVLPCAQAQADDDDGSNSLGDNTPFQNVDPNAVAVRAPATWIDEARSRHNELSEARLAAQSTGDVSSLLPGSNTSSSTSDSDDSSASTDDSSSSDDSTSSLPSEVLELIAAAGIDISGLSLKSSNADETSTTDDQTSKSSSSTLSSSDEDRDFIVRWADSMLSTLFTSLAVVVQTDTFIERIKDVFRPLLGVESSDDDETTSSLRLKRPRGAYPGGTGTRPLLC